MKTNLKRLFSLMLVLVMVCSMLPLGYMVSAAEPEDIVLTDEDYAIVNDVFAQIDAMEDAPAKKSASRTQITDAAAEIVMASENYVEGSLERNGNSFTWWTDEGIRCIYNPYMREKYENMEAPANAEPSGIYNEPKATKGGWPSGNQVYLVAPYYGLDDSFTDQYKNEAKAIASAIGDTDGYTLYSGSSVTVDNVADAMENGAVVIFDSHGTTDYDGAYIGLDPDGYEVYDYVSQANYSYICLTNKSGLTTADYNAGATYFTDSEGLMCACVNGAAIANHMEGSSPAGLLWMAICLGMATDTMCEPMRAKGVEVVYGYSQSVTFAGDYCFEETFWDNMIAGKDVATSIAAMKSKWGNWDWSEAIAASYGYSGSGYTLSEARQYRSAFPIVVSDEDAHPGQRDSGTNYGACSEQTVKSTYTLYSQYNVTAQSNNTAYGTVSVNGSTITATPASGYFAQGYTVTSGTATVTQNGNTFSVVAESDCTVQINFAAKTAVTVNFSGANVSGQTGYAGDAMSLPTAEAPEGYKFLGWTTAPLSGETTEKPEFYTDSFIPTGNTTLYALYSYVDSTSGGGSGDYVKVTETPDDWSGEYLIVYEAGSRVFDGSLSTLEAVSNYQDVTISDNTISAEEADAYRFIIAAMDGGYSIQSASGMYISGTSGSNKLNAGTTASANTITIDASGNADIVSNTSHLRYNATSGQDRFRYYKSTSYSSQKAIALYVKDGSAGTTYYTSVLCDHENVTDVAAVAATCTETGFTAGTQCTDCGSYVTGHEVIAALGHSWSDWTETTTPGCETAGEQTRTCSVCGETETQEVAATGHSVDAGTVTTPATCTEDGVMTYTCSACGNTTTEAIPATGHSYVDGVCSACGEAEPEITGYYIAAIRSSGNYYYMTSDLGTASTNRYQAVDSGLTVLPETITNPETGYVFNLIDNGDGTYSIQAVDVEGDNYLGHTSGNSGTLVGEASALKLTMTDNGDGTYSFSYAASDATRYLALNGTTNNNYFAWYKSGQKQNLALIPVGGTSEPEVTEPEVSEPEVTEPEVTEPEITEPEVTEPEASEPAGSVTTLQYVFSDYAAGTQYAQGEDHTLDDVVTLTINGAHLNGQIRLYAGSNAVFTSAKEIDAIIVKAGYKVGTLNVYASADGSTWESVAEQATTTTYTNYSFDIPAGSYYVMLEGIGAQIRVSEMSVDVLAAGTTEPTDPTEPEVTEPEVTEPEVTEPSGSATGVQMVTSPVAGTAYKLYLEQTTLGQTLYFAGTVANKEYYLATTEDVNAATDVYLEATDGGYYLYFMDGSTKTYIDMYQSGTYYNIRLAASPSAVYTYDSEYNTLIALNGDTNCFIGTHSSYNTMSCCKESYLSSNFVSHLGLPTDAPVEPDPSEPTEPEVTEPEVTEPEATEPVGSSATIDFSTTDQRVSQDAESQVWSNAGATLTNNKGSSASEVADYSNPARFYKNSDIIITFPGMIKIEVTCSSDAYATTLASSISNATVSAEGQVVTIVFTEAVDEFSFTLTSGQVRAKELTVYAAAEEAECTHENTTTTTVESTCTVAGSVTVTCDDCGEVISTEELPLADHAYESVVTPPTTESQGYTTHTCSVCGDSYQDNIKNVLPSGDATLKFLSAYLRLESDMTVTFLVKSEIFAEGKYTNPRVEYSIPDVLNNSVRNQVLTEYTTNADGRMLFPFTGISPRMMKATITATLYGTYEGVEYSFTMTYSLADYCYNQLNKTSNIQNKPLFLTLLADLLNFGTAHQKYAGHDVENLINADMTEAHKSYASKYELQLNNHLDLEAEVIDSPTADFKGASLYMANAISVRLIVHVEDTTDVKLVISCDGKDYTIPYSEETWVPHNTLADSYVIDFDELMAKQMSSLIHATVYRNNEVISNTMQYSIESYISKNITKENMKELLTCMIYYGKSAAAYFS